MKMVNARHLTRDLALYALSYTLWLATILVSVLAVLELRVAISALWVAAGGDRYTTSFLDQVSLLLGGSTAFVYVMWLEPYYEKGLQLRQSPKMDDKVPALPRGGAAHWLGTLRVDILLSRWAVTFAIPFALFLLSLVVYQIALNAI